MWFEIFAVPKNENNFSTSIAIIRGKSLEEGMKKYANAINIRVNCINSKGNLYEENGGCWKTFYIKKYNPTSDIYPKREWKPNANRMLKFTSMISIIPTFSLFSGFFHREKYSYTFKYYGIKQIGGEEIIPETWCRNNAIHAL